MSASDGGRIGRYAVIPTRNRPAELARCVEAISPQVDAVVIVDNGSDPPACPPIVDGRGHLLIHDPEQPPNLSKLWNEGLNVAHAHAYDAGLHGWDVAVLNDDAEPPPGWFETVAAAMREHGCAAGSSDAHGTLTAPLIYREARTDNAFHRLCGWAFVLRGESELRADERLRWWYGDDDLDWRARQAGGTVVIPGFPVPNTRANSTTVGALAEQAGKDRATFVEKWSESPW